MLRASPTPFLFLLLCALLPAQGTQRLTFEDTRKPIQWQGEVPQVRWADDGQHLELRAGRERILIDPRTGERSKAEDGVAPVEPTVRKVAMVRDGDVYVGTAGPGGRRRPGRQGAPDAAAGGERLTNDGGDKRETHLSADGQRASYVSGNDLYAIEVADKTVWRITDDGGPELFHGLLDWVYQEEIYGRGDFQGHWWAPQGGNLAFLSLDESPVKEFTIVDHVPDGFLDKERSVVTEVANYPKVGDPNPFARLSIANCVSKQVVAVDLSMFPKDLLVMRVEWTPDGSTLLATISDRIQTWAELCAIDPATGKLTRWIREDSPTWVNRPEPLRWLADGSFLWLSERTGYAHVYHYAKGGELLGAITAGEWQVRSIVRVDEAAKVLWFEGTEGGATGRHLYRVGFDGKGLVNVTPGVGTHTFDLDPSGALVLDRWSAMDRPTTVRVLDASTGKVLIELGQADKGAAKDYAFSERQRVTIAARDGYELDACVMLPIGWQEGGKYPVFLPTYSGPDAPTVRDSWSHSTYHQFLCQQGFVVLQVNVRSASGRGQKHTGTCYKQLGVQELKDLEDAVDHVCAKFGGDPARVAISGWSYGGFITAYALTHSDKFALGLAGAGVYDWRLYDTIYTERYMRTPTDNLAGYQATSVIGSAKNLRGHLVLLHGSMDDNVHMQNTMQFVWELQKAGKQNFELMIYPKSRHGLNRAVNAHSQELQWLRLSKLLTSAK